MKNYYELFHYSVADGGTYSDIDLSDLGSRYAELVRRIDINMSFVDVGSPEYADQKRKKDLLKKAYDVLSNAETRAAYDSFLVSAPSRDDSDLDLSGAEDPAEEETKPKKGRKVIKVVGAVALTGALIAGLATYIASNRNNNDATRAMSNTGAVVTTTAEPTEEVAIIATSSAEAVEVDEEDTQKAIAEAAKAQAEAEAAKAQAEAEAAKAQAEAEKAKAEAAKAQAEAEAAKAQAEADAAKAQAEADVAKAQAEAEIAKVQAEADAAKAQAEAEQRAYAPVDPTSVKEAVEELPVEETVQETVQEDVTAAVTPVDPTSVKEAVEELPVEETVQEDIEDSVDYRVRTDVVDLGDILDDQLVMQRATKLAQDLDAANVINPLTSSRFTVDELFALIRYASGVYIPSSVEEIDVLHLNLLNLLVSPINTDGYLYHVVYASGNDDFTNLLDPNMKHALFGEAFAAYGENGVYPLVQWFQQKRVEIYSSTNREEINSIYREVGQVMADLMKGNGCTIDLDGKTYQFTSEEVLANHSSAAIISVEFQLIMANHYEIRNEMGEVVDAVSQNWEVYNKLNSNGVDDLGNPVIEPDIVTYDEMNAWVNNGCDYEWQIDNVLINGQTFGQRIQSDLEGMALNNYHMYYEGQSLTK